MGEDQKPIAFEAAFSKATTLVDGGWRVTLDMGEDSWTVAAELARLKGQRLQVVVVPIEESHG